MAKQYVPIHLSPQFRDGAEAMTDAVRSIEVDFINRNGEEGCWKAIFAVMVTRKIDPKTGEVENKVEWEAIEKKPGRKSEVAYAQIKGDQLLLPMFGSDVRVLSREDEATEAERRG